MVNKQGLRSMKTAIKMFPEFGWIEARKSKISKIQSFKNFELFKNSKIQNFEGLEFECKRAPAPPGPPRIKVFGPAKKHQKSKIIEQKKKQQIIKNHAKSMKIIVFL